MDVAVTSCLAATASAARARLRLQKDPLNCGRISISAASLLV